MPPPDTQARKLCPKGIKGHWDLAALNQEDPETILPILLEWIHLSAGPVITRPRGPDL